MSDLIDDWWNLMLDAVGPMVLAQGKMVGFCLLAVLTLAVLWLIMGWVQLRRHGQFNGQVRSK